MVEDYSEIGHWLATQSRAQCTALATRAALRALGFSIIGKVTSKSDQLVLLGTFRALICASSTHSGTDRDLQNACDLAAKRGPNNFAPADAALYAARSAAEEESSRYLFAAESALNTAGIAFSVGSQSLEKEIIRDANSAAKFDLMTLEVSVPPELQIELDRYADGKDNLLKSAEHWFFWSRWYDRAMSGNLLPWDLQRGIALIPDDIWRQGPEAVAERIAEIEARFEVKQKLCALQAERALQAATSRHGIGGNAPPEPIELPVEA
ncbi:hypothetical protein [Pseudooceanicola algae]|uniref:Uncharacterized protein n=1 Tax=Pseudooceanicola algae TaxID=1537215 RepID=A0A418SI56_9RHOB|nr:hypothetical protein [Pseudooceanicola algae]QPM92115.1 hypothetical protein PSAL_033780 [Pseudooceanicola algae]